VREDIQPVRTNWFWANLRDEWRGTTNRDNTLKRWAADLQNDFRARLDWCVKPFAAANHPPIAVLNGDQTKRILFLAVRPGSRVALDATGSSDPDRNQLAFEWTTYPEAGTYRGEVPIVNAYSEVAQLTVPSDSAGKDIHILLLLHDDGNPPLAAYRRAVIQVNDSR
jgi:hypothetical protein